MIEPRLTDLLANAFPFRGLPEADLSQVMAAAHTRSLGRSEFFFHQGDPASSIYVLISGRARSLQLTPEGNQVLLSYLGPGDMFGGVAFLGQPVYPLSVEAVDDSRAASWNGDTMAQLMMRYPRIALNALQFMSNRIQELQDRVRELSTERVERRIASTLLRLTQQTGQKTAEGIVLNVALSRQDIAEMSGTTLYTVSRVLTRWEQRGIVATGRERIVILSPHGLVSIAQDLPTGQESSVDGS